MTLSIIFPRLLNIWFRLVPWTKTTFDRSGGLWNPEFSSMHVFIFLFEPCRLQHAQDGKDDHILIRFYMKSHLLLFLHNLCLDSFIWRPSQSVSEHEEPNRFHNLYAIIPKASVIAPFKSQFSRLTNASPAYLIISSLETFPEYWSPSLLFSSSDHTIPIWQCKATCSVLD